MVPTKKRMTKQEQRDASIEKLLASAEQLFITKGFHATTTEELGAHAGLTKGSVYFYFGDKNTVLLNLLEKVQARVLSPLIEKLEAESLSPLARIREFLVHQARLAKDDPAMLLLPIMVSIEFAGTGDEAEKRVKWGYRRTAQLLAKVIADGQTSGVFRRDLEATQQASIILALNDGAMLEWWRSDRRFAGRGLFDALYAVLLSGIVQPHNKEMANELSSLSATVGKTSRNKKEK
jgi:AcrR family transcriptional regulator